MAFTHTKKIYMGPFINSKILKSHLLPSTPLEKKGLLTAYRKRVHTQTLHYGNLVREVAVVLWGVL
jgi:hypothetical protein